MADFNNPLQSYASYGDNTISPGMLLYHEAKHYECYAATEAAGPFNPLNTIGVLISPPDIYLVLAAEFNK